MASHANVGLEFPVSDERAATYLQPSPLQKSNVTLNLANRAEVIDNGFRYVATGLRSVGEYDVW
jgi:hypothetical protein